MRIRRRSRRLPVLVLGAVTLVASAALRAEGPLYVGGTFGVPGQPFRWRIDPLTYWTDLGTLGTLTNNEADMIVDQAFQAWEDVPTAAITLNQEGNLPQDVTGQNIMAVLDQLNDCSTPINPNNPSFLARERTVVYDTNGGALTALGEDPDVVLGVASPLCLASNGTENFFQRGFALLNGKSTKLELQDTMTHEFGHLLGLDHSQINLNCLTSLSGCSADDEAGVPIMFPVAVTASPKALAPDDVAGVSILYPEMANNPPTQLPFSSFGRIRGHVLFGDGVTPSQGFNVIARQVDNPRRIAVSVVSGFLFTACVTNPVLPAPNNDCGELTPFGSRDQTLIGFFDIPGLPVELGQRYTIEVEALHNSFPFPFVGGSSVGPIGAVGFQFALPGPCTPQYLFSPMASCTDKTVLQPAAGQILETGTDVILLSTLPRYDAWEDGP